MLFDFAHLSDPLPFGRPALPIVDFHPPVELLTRNPPDISNIVSFARAHRWADHRMKRYLESPQDRYVALASRSSIEDLRLDHGLFMNANNASARIAFAQTALKRIEAAASRWDRPIHLVTLVPNTGAKEFGDSIALQNVLRHPGPDSDFWQWSDAERRERRLQQRSADITLRRNGPAACFDVQILQAMAREALRGVPFIGMIEASIWRFWSKDRRSYHDVISWHCHLIVWSASHDDLTRLLRPFRERHVSLKTGTSPAHVKEVPYRDLVRQVLYILKAPMKISEVKYFPLPWKNTRTGKLREAGWHVQKDWMKTGQRVRLLDVIGERRLDQLLFGNGAGTTIVRAIRKDALARRELWITADKRRNPQHYGLR